MAQNTAAQIASAELEGDAIHRASAVAALQAVQNTQVASLETEIQNLITLWVLPGS